MSRFSYLNLSPEIDSALERIFNRAVKALIDAREADAVSARFGVYNRIYNDRLIRRSNYYFAIVDVVCNDMRVITRSDFVAAVEDAADKQT